jgi:hypothetical protein
MNRQNYDAPKRSLLWAACVVVSIFILNLSAAAEEENDFFESRIRPLLVDRCYECHGPDEAAGKLRLDSKVGWQRGGKSGPAIVPTEPASSLLLRAVMYKDAELKMPPEDAGGKLTDQQIDDLAYWIRQGAHDPRVGEVLADPISVSAKQHWAFQPISSPAISPHDPISSDGIPPQSAVIDMLIEKQWGERKFEPTESAEVRSLIRRGSYDLHGLPPTPEQMATSTDDFPSLVDEMLTSPRYGERWARHWLDVARYSDAKDGVLMYGDARIRPFAYTYRDYVIRAFNDDKPFDQFVREQIAADRLGLPQDSPDLAAMGLLTLGRMFDNNRHDVIDDQIDVVTRGFLGLTASCARCHDHKFDPIPTADYYSLYGVFGSCREPYQRPRIESTDGRSNKYEQELQAKLDEVSALQSQRYDETLRAARERTADYLVKVATTEPDISETSIFFLSLVEGQLRPQITYRWRKLIAQRAFADDSIFAPWHDLMRDYRLQPEAWKANGVDERIIDAMVSAKPKTATEVAQVYGEVIQGVWGQESAARKRIAEIDRRLSALHGGVISLADVVAGGDGFGAGTKGNGIHPVTGEPTSGQVGFIDIPQPNVLIPAASNPFVDGVFVPQAADFPVTTTGIRASGLPGTTGVTWDYFRFGPSSGFSTNLISDVDYNSPPNTILAMHANKGITFDLAAMREAHGFQESRFTAVLGHGGEKGKSLLDFRALIDGKTVLEIVAVAAQQAGAPLDILLPADARFLTLVVTEGGLGISHDQAILGNPSIAPTNGKPQLAKAIQESDKLLAKRSQVLLDIAVIGPLQEDPIAQLLVEETSPVWFPKHEIYFYLSRQQKDAFRGVVNQLDAISVAHADAAARAMVLVDSEKLLDPVIFQRGDPSQPGARIPRQFLRVLSPAERVPFADGSGRRSLAEAIASPANPLTARVWVNRVWMHHFGEPLVQTPSDFGLRTKQPIQHELLDYLAGELIRGGWRTKRIHKIIMCSKAYQRASQLGDVAALKLQQQNDPDNHYLWRVNRRRLDLEQMRDTLLFLSGNTDWSMYGRPTLITDTKNRRRTIYAFVERQTVPSIVKIFDFANADTSTARRVSTIVPQQALFAMNAPFMIDTAQLIAKRVSAAVGERNPNDDGNVASVRELYQLVLGRSPSEDEANLGKDYLTSGSLESYAQVLLMTNEFMFVD